MLTFHDGMRPDGDCCVASRARDADGGRVGLDAADGACVRRKWTFVCAHEHETLENLKKGTL